MKITDTGLCFNFEIGLNNRLPITNLIRWGFKTNIREDFYKFKPRVHTKERILYRELRKQ